MAVVLRLRRTGRKNLPCFRIIATDSRFPRNGRLLETLGLYDPLRKEEEKRIQLDEERARHWLSVGALPSDVVASILRTRGIHARVPARRKRPARSKTTATRTRRDQVKAARATAKKERFTARRAAKRAAAKATAAAAPETAT